MKSLRLLTFCCFFTTITISIVIADIDTINPLELNRLFTTIHHERMQQKALNLLPGAHSHEGIIDVPSRQVASQPPVVQGPIAPPVSLAPSAPSAPPVSLAPSAPILPARPITQRQQPSPVVGLPPQRNMMNTFLKSSPNSLNIDNFALTSIEATRRLIQTKLNDQKNPFPALAKLKAPPRFCPFKNLTSCDPQYPYRTHDGSCNNLKNPWWGQSEMPYKRYLDAEYADGLNEPRVSADGSELPNARDLACNLHSEVYDVEPFVTNMFMQWGQVVNHDVTSLAITMDGEEEMSRCNTCERTAKCLPIMISLNQTCSCQNQMSHKCIEFKRSSASFGDPHCSLGRREQLNLVSPFLDGSILYGENDEKAESLRDRKTGRGLLLIQQNGLLPQDKTPKPADCLDFKETQRCFRAGDDRVNQNPGLMSTQTLLLREHNRIAKILSSLNPQWQDETVYQEARRIVIAMLQHITYNEYLPILLGPTTTKRFDLLPNRGMTYFTKYNPNLDPRLANEYSAAAGRFGHSMIRGRYSRANSEFVSDGPSYHLRNAYFRANFLYDQCEGGLESVIRGMLRDPIMKIDRHFSSDISQHLFETHDELGRPFHFDLIAINIARGRDHGVPSYIRWREFCGLPPLRTWTQLKQAIPEDAVQLFKSFYRYVDDIDLFTAAVSENRLPDALVGPTLACILGTTFKDMKFADRFWYETNAPPARFTTRIPPQLNEIRKMSLSKLLCRNMADTPKIQARAMVSFRLEDNPLVDCNNLTDINWHFWKAA